MPETVAMCHDILLLVDRDHNRDRRNTIRDHDQFARPGFNSRRHIELRRDDRSARGDAHRAVSMRLAVEHMSSSVVGDARSG